MNTPQTQKNNYPRIKNINGIEVIKQEAKIPWLFKWKDKTMQFENFFEAREFILLESERPNRHTDLLIAKNIFKNKTDLFKETNELGHDVELIKIILNHEDTNSVLKIPEYTRNIHDLYKLINFLQKKKCFVSIFSTGKHFTITLQQDSRIKEFECSFKNLARDCSLEILNFYQENT